MPKVETYSDGGERGKKIVKSKLNYVSKLYDATEFENDEKGEKDCNLVEDGEHRRIGTDDEKENSEEENDGEEEIEEEGSEGKKEKICRCKRDLLYLLKSRKSSNSTSNPSPISSFSNISSRRPAENSHPSFENLRPSSKEKSHFLNINSRFSRKQTPPSSFEEISPPPTEEENISSRASSKIEISHQFQPTYQNIESFPAPPQPAPSGRRKIVKKLIRVEPVQSRTVNRRNYEDEVASENLQRRYRRKKVKIKKRRRKPNDLNSTSEEEERKKTDAEINSKRRRVVVKKKRPVIKEKESNFLEGKEFLLINKNNSLLDSKEDSTVFNQNKSSTLLNRTETISTNIKKNLSEEELSESSGVLRENNKETIESSQRTNETHGQSRVVKDRAKGTSRRRDRIKTEVDSKSEREESVGDEKKVSIVQSYGGEERDIESKRQKDKKQNAESVKQDKPEKRNEENGKESKETLEEEKQQETTKEQSTEQNQSPQNLPDYEPFFPELSESLDAPILLLKTTVLSSIEYQTKTTETTRLRTYTFIVTRVNGDEREVTSTTEVKPQTKTIVVTEPITRFTTLTLLDFDSTKTLKQQSTMVPLTDFPPPSESSERNRYVQGEF